MKEHCNNMVSLWGKKKVGPRPGWSSSRVFQNFRRASPSLLYVSPPGKKYTYCVTLRYISCSVTRQKKNSKNPDREAALVAIFFPFNLRDRVTVLPLAPRVPI